MSSSVARRRGDRAGARLPVQQLVGRCRAGRAAMKPSSSVARGSSPPQVAADDRADDRRRRHPGEQPPVRRGRRGCGRSTPSAAATARDRRGSRPRAAPRRSTATSSVAGRRRLPSTRPTSPPASGDREAPDGRRATRSTAGAYCRSSTACSGDDPRPHAEPARPPTTPRWPRGCARRRSTRSSARSTCSAAGSALRTAIEQGAPHSMILYGPPGTGQDDARAARRRATPTPPSRSSRAVQAGRPRCAR